MKKHVVIVSNLYPNINEPNRGVFIKQLTDNLSDDYDITVVAPTPWRPKLFNVLKGLTSLPSKDNVGGIDVFYPRHIVIPKILRSTYGWFMAYSLGRLLNKINTYKQIDLISSHWVYPDGYGAVKVAKNMNIPVTVHALGCDINEYSKYPSRRKKIIETIKNSDRVVVKSSELASKVEALAGENTNIRTIMNGVDQVKFKSMNMRQARIELGLDPDLDFLTFIGNIQEEKGLNYLLEAFKNLQCKDIPLLIIGSGPQEEVLKEYVKNFDKENNIKFIGTKPHNEIPLYLSATNGLCLPSLREGCPNIVLEALSCGTPVLASRVGAVPQMIKDKCHGITVEPKSVDQLTNALPELIKMKSSNPFTFKWPTWKDNADEISNLFQEILP